ncbi:MAG: hypothetical protein GC164_06450 [Phycisphaera sp.]|nr:hypothetical protein [Phycisphaera sp.]
MPTPTPAAKLDRKRWLQISKLDWPVVIGIVAVHVGAVVAPFYFSWTGMALFVALVFLTGSVGITLTYHRLLTHRSFRTPKWFEYVLATIGTLAWQGGPIQWVGTHRIHHKHSDKELDPHSPKHGFTWSHMTWCMHLESEGKRGKDAAKDLQRDAGLLWIDRLAILPQLLLVLVLFAVGHFVVPWFGFETMGLSWVLWGVCLRTVVVYHGTWFVNSASHTWGYRNFETTDHSTNLWWVAILSFGEGWHNNHHAYQRSARHGLRWFEFDLTYLIIKVLSWVGLAKDIVLPKPEEMPGHKGTVAVQESNTHNLGATANSSVGV